MMESFIELILLPINDWRIGLISILIGIYFYSTRNFGYFKSIGLKNVKPYPIIGSGHIFWTENGATKDMLGYIEKYGKMFGMFSGSTPEFVVADEQLLKEVFATNFESFGGHMVYKTGNKYMDRNLTNLIGNEWRRVRRLLTPAFSTGKLKGMADDINKSCKELVDILKTKTEKNKEMDVKFIGGNFTLDVIGSTAFGLVTDSQRNPNNQFIKNAKMIIPSTELSLQTVALMIATIVPGALDWFAKVGLSIIPSSCMDFFSEIFDKLLDSRENQINQRNDFMALMAKAYKLNQENEANEQFEKGLDKVEVIAAGFIFFFAGYDTVSSGLAACLYHLADNAEWQEKVFEEIQTVVSEDGDDLSYEHLKDMPLLEMCIEESLRLTPPAPLNDRIATKDCYLNDIFIKKGTHIWIPVYAIHHHPDFYEDPEKFDPYRFTTEAKASRSSVTYQAFGAGPRECLGKRMAIMEMKMGLVHLIRSFKFSLSGDRGEKLSLNAIGVSKALITFHLRQ